MSEQQSSAPQAPGGAPIGFAEFVALIASLMSLTAWGIDAMLPALPAFVAGFGIAQLFHGTLADPFGRRRLLIVALLTCAAANGLAASTHSFTLLLIARGRVATLAIVRDCYQGRAMARAMSITFMVFMIVPVLAPALGQGLPAIHDSWRLILWVIAGTASSVQGFGSVTLGTVIGAVIGQAFDGTTGPLALGYAVTAAMALAIVFRTERGKLFTPA